MESKTLSQVKELLVYKLYLKIINLVAAESLTLKQSILQELGQDLELCRFLEW